MVLDMTGTELGLDENVEGALSYLLGWVTGIIFFFVEDKNDFVRFHGLQSIVVFGILSALFLVILVLSFVVPLFSTILGAIPLLGWILGAVGAMISLVISLGVLFLLLVYLVLLIVLMVKAYQGEKFKLPLIGDFVEGHI